MKGPLNCTNSELSTYLRALGVGYLPTSFLVTNVSAPSKSMTIASKSYQHGKKMVSFPGFRFLVTSNNSTEIPGGDSLMSSPVGFLAKISAHPGIGRDLREKKARYGEMRQGWFAKFDHESLSWKTPQPSLFGVLPELCPIWPKWGMMRSGVCWELPTPFGLMALRRMITNAFDALSRLPTPTVHGNYNRKGASKTSGDGLATAIKRLPTPMSRDWKDSGPTQGNRHSPKIGTVLSRLPTPTASDNKVRKPPKNFTFSKTGIMRHLNPEGIQSQCRLCQVITDGGPMNPEWVEWLMGWPIGMTGLEPLEMGRFQRWLLSHGIC